MVKEGGRLGILLVLGHILHVNRSVTTSLLLSRHTGNLGITFSRERDLLRYPHTGVQAPCAFTTLLSIGTPPRHRLLHSLIIIPRKEDMRPGPRWEGKGLEDPGVRREQKPFHLLPLFFFFVCEARLVFCLKQDGCPSEPYARKTTSAGKDAFVQLATFIIITHIPFTTEHFRSWTFASA